MEQYRILVKGIVKKEDHYLIAEKWLDDNIVDPYQWNFVDGEVDFGEAPDSAVVRQILEQTNLEAIVDRILYTWTFMLGSVCNLGIAYLCLTDMEEDDVVLSEDFHGYRWIAADEMEEYINNTRLLRDLHKAEMY